MRLFFDGKKVADADLGGRIEVRSLRKGFFENRQDNKNDCIFCIFDPTGVQSKKRKRNLNIVHKIRKNFLYFYQELDAQIQRCNFRQKRVRISRQASSSSIFCQSWPIKITSPNQEKFHEFFFVTVLQQVEGYRFRTRWKKEAGTF